MPNLSTYKHNTGTQHCTLTCFLLCLHQSLVLMKHESSHLLATGLFGLKKHAGVIKFLHKLTNWKIHTTYLVGRLTLIEGAFEVSTIECWPWMQPKVENQFHHSSSQIKAPHHAISNCTAVVGWKCHKHPQHQIFK